MASSDAEPKGDLEAATPTNNKLPHFRMVYEQASITTDIFNHPWPGAGTEDDPYVVSWTPDDPRNPLNFSQVQKWSITALVAIATLAVALVSSAYSGGTAKIMVEFDVGTEVVILGVSLFVLGFAIGPLLWAPLSEMFGRQILFIITYGALTAFNAGAAGAKNIETLLVLRFFAGAFGSSPLTNAGGVIADMFHAHERGLAMSVFAAAPFLGPTLGPVIGGFLGMAKGWRWVEGFLAIFSGVLWLLGAFLIPETYAPVLLRKRAEHLGKMTGKVYVSKLELERGKVSLKDAFSTALSRPWVLLIFEPIVLLLSVYMAIIYGTLYMLFAAYPIVYQQHRGWNEGVGGLPFLGVMVGMLFAVACTLPDNKRYIRVANKHGGFAPPESRLPPCLVGGIAIPVGLFWFAWTNSPSVHWMASIAAGAPFGFGMVLVFLSVMNYLIDSYTIYAASVLAANSVIRSLFGAAFPLFTRYMYANLGIHWASSIPAFLALACVPFPFLFYKYGATIRKRCKYASEADAFMRKLQAQAEELALSSDKEEDPAADTQVEEKDRNQEAESGTNDLHPVESSSSSSDNSSQRRYARINTGGHPLAHHGTAHSARSSRSDLRRTMSEYDGNPYDIDRVNTRHSAVSIKSSKSKKHATGTK